MPGSVSLYIVLTIINCLIHLLASICVVSGPVLTKFYLVIVFLVICPSISPSVTRSTLTGYARGTTEFDKAFFAQDAAVIDNLIIDKEKFLQFFDGEDDKFSFMHMWRLVDRLWEAWDCNAPILLHGFITPLVSEKMLALRSKQPGSFLMRWSSRGGLAVDFVRDGRLEKAHWKFGSLTDINSLRALLWDPIQWGPALQFLVDTTNEAGFNVAVVAKDVCFPNVQSYEDDTHMDSDTPAVRSGYNMIR